MAFGVGVGEAATGSDLAELGDAAAFAGFLGFCSLAATASAQDRIGEKGVGALMAPFCGLSFSESILDAFGCDCGFDGDCG